MPTEKEIINSSWPSVQAELDRIGVHSDDAPHASLGLNRPFTSEGFASFVNVLRSVPSGVGLVGLMRHLGVDEAAIAELKKPLPNEEL